MRSIRWPQKTVSTFTSSNLFHWSCTFIHDFINIYSRVFSCLMINWSHQFTIKIQNFISTPDSGGFILIVEAYEAEAMWCDDIWGAIDKASNLATTLKNESIIVTWKYLNINESELAKASIMQCKVLGERNKLNWFTCFLLYAAILIIREWMIDNTSDTFN